MAYGLSEWYIEKQFSFLTLLLVVIWLFSSLLCIQSIRHKSTGTATMAKKVLFVAFIVLLFTGLTALVNYMAYFYNFRLDLTQSKQHTLSKRTEGILGHLKHDIKVTVLYVGITPQYLTDLLSEYERRSSGKIKTKIIDPIVDIGYAAQFGNVISGKQMKAIVQSRGERRDIDFTDKPLSEENLNNAIIRVTRKGRKVYFLSGHGEYGPFDESDTGLNTFVRHLLANNIVSESLLISTEGAMPEDCDLLVIAGPKSELSEKEEKTIQEYLEKGGDALILIEHTVVTTSDIPLSEDQLNKNPSLNSLLKPWGVKVEQDIVVDLANHAGGDVGSPATRNYMPHEALIRNLDYTFYVRPRSISIVKDRRPTVRGTPFVLTESGKSSWAETNRELNVKFDEGIDRPGPIPISYVIHEPKEEGDHSDTRLLVFTDADFLTNIYIGQYSNVQMGFNIVNWLTELDYQLMEEEEEIKVKNLYLTSKQKRMVLAVLIFMPLLIMVLGISVWIKYRIE